MTEIKILCANHAQALLNREIEGKRSLHDLIRANAGEIKKILAGEEVDHSACDAFWASFPLN